MIIVIIKIAASILIGFFAGPAAVWVFNHMPAKWLCDYGESPEERERIVGLSGTLTDGGVSSNGKGTASVNSSNDGAAVKRIKENPWRWVFSVGFICLCLRLSLADILDGMLDSQNQAGSAEPGTGGAGEVLQQAADSSTGASVQLAVVGLVACWVLLIIALADLKYMIIPDQFVLLLAVSSVGFMPYFRHVTEKVLTGGASGSGSGYSGTASGGTATGVDAGYWPAETLGAFGEPLIGFAIGAGFMLLCALAGRLIYKQQAFGFGDVKLCGAMGLVLGINGIIAAVAAGIIISGFVAAAGLATKKYKPKEQKPLGPYLCGGAMAYIFIVMPLM